jgi:hypothetical protein
MQICELSYSKFIFVMTNKLELFFVRFFYKINKNYTVDKDLNCHIIVAAKMNQFPKRSIAPISKQTKQHILKTFNKIKEMTHGDNRNAIKKYKIVETNDVTHNLIF